MQKAALWHTCRAPFAYPVDPEHIRLVLLTARNDLKSATVLYADRYAADGSENALQMGQVGDDGIHDYWAVTVPVPTRRLRYKIGLLGSDGEVLYLNESGLTSRRNQGQFFQFAYLHRNDLFQIPEWLRGAIFYQIFPDRFCNGDKRNDPPKTAPWGTAPTATLVTGGDLAGIESKLGYLTDLGVNALYTTPLFRSPSNHKYDTADYYTIDPAFGNTEALTQLVEAAHSRGLRFVLDAVFNHCGREWFPFQDVLTRGEQSAYRDWFYDLRAFPVDTKAVNYETFANHISVMPKLDTGNPDCAAYLLAVAEYWIRTAKIDGWRLDVANEVDHRFWRQFRDRVKSANPDTYILGEIWHDATDWMQGEQFDGVMDYGWRTATLQFLKGEQDAREYDHALTRLRFAQTSTAHRGMLHLLGSHDTTRIRTEVGGIEKAALAAVLLLTAPGVPLLYYGDEIGMEGSGDIGARGCYPWDSPKAQNTDLLRLYKRLIQIRRAFPWLADGAWQTITADPHTNLFVYRRLPTPLESPMQNPDEDGITVVLNNASVPNTLTLPVADAHVKNLLSGEMQSAPIEDNGEGKRLVLPPFGIAVLGESSAVLGQSVGGLFGSNN